MGRAVNLRELFKQALVGIGLLPLRFIVQCLLIYKCFSLNTGAGLAGGLAKAVALTATYWLTIMLVRFGLALIPGLRRRLLAAIDPEASELYQLKLCRQNDEKQKKFLAELNGPFTVDVVARPLRASLYSLVPTIISIAIAAFFFTRSTVFKTPIVVLECTVLIIVADLIFTLGHSLLVHGKSTGAVAPEAQSSGRGRLATFGAVLQESDELIRTAEARFQLEVQTNPCPPAYNERGKHYITCHKFVDAIDDFSRAIALDENFAEAYESRAEAYAGMHLPNMARREFDEACRRYGEQGREAERRRAHDKYTDLSAKSNAPVIGMRESLTAAAFFFNPKKLDELKQIELKRINTDLEKNSRTANMYCKKAEILYMQKEYGEALLTCDKAISANSQEAAAYRIRAQIKIQQLKIPEALKDYDKAIELNEKDGDAFLGRARLYFIALQDPQAALKDCTHAMSFSPNRQLQLLRGEILITLDRCELAVSDLTEVIDSWERFSSLWDCFFLPIFKSIANGLREESIGVYQKRAEAYEKLGQLDKCAQDLARAENLKKITQGKSRAKDKSGQKLH
jgi:tetratricopeptide (TPR) repeat protein